MSNDLPPLIWLRAFEASARTLSFTNAAAELHVTQAAVSKHVKSLELYLRHPLFLRHARGISLTKSGEAYLPKVQDAFARLALGTREVFGQRGRQGITLRCAVSFAVNWLAPRLPAFLAQYPTTPLRVISSVWNDPFDKESFDLDIQYGKGDWAGCIPHRLTWDSITPVCAPDLPARLPLAAPDDLRHHRLLHVLGYQEGWGIWLAAAGAFDVDSGQGVQLDTSLTAFEIAAQGGGVALGRSSLLQRDFAAGRLIAPFDLAVPIDEAFYLLEPEGGATHPDAKRVVDWITAQVAPKIEAQ